MSKLREPRVLLAGVVAAVLGAVLAFVLVRSGDERRAVQDPVFVDAAEASLSACTEAAGVALGIEQDISAELVLAAAGSARAAADAALRLDSRWVQLDSAAQSLEAALRHDDGGLAHLAIRLLDDLCRPLAVQVLPR